MQEQKSIAQILDTMASRSRVPATGKQCWFLAGLIAKSGENVFEVFPNALNMALDKKMASTMIDSYLSEVA